MGNENFFVAGPNCLYQDGLGLQQNVFPGIQQELKGGFRPTVHENCNYRRHSLRRSLLCIEGVPGLDFVPRDSAVPQRKCIARSWELGAVASMKMMRRAKGVSHCLGPFPGVCMNPLPRYPTLCDPHSWSL